MNREASHSSAEGLVCGPGPHDFPILAPLCFALIVQGIREYPLLPVPDCVASLSQSELVRQLCGEAGRCG